MSPNGWELEWQALVFALQGRCPSGQRERAVNPSALAFGGSNPPRPTKNFKHGPTSKRRIKSLLQLKNFI